MEAKKDTFSNKRNRDKKRLKKKPWCLEKQSNLPMFGSKRKVLDPSSKMASRYLPSNLRGPSEKD